MRFALLLPMLLLAACAQTPAPYQGLDYSTAPHNRMNLAAVLVDDATTPADPSSFAASLNPAPVDVVRNAIAQHYRVERANSMGATTLRFVVKDLTVTETRLLPEDRDWWTTMTETAPEFRYEGHLAIETTSEGMSQRRGFVSAEASRTLEVAHLSPAARQRQVQGMVSQMVDDIIAQLDKEVRANMGGFVISGPDMQHFPQRSNRWDNVLNPPPSRAGVN